MASIDIDKIRAVRTNPSIRLRPSPFLKDTYVDEYGIEQPVAIRNYQAQGVMNLLQVTRMVLGDDTGLGKTLEILSAIGYVWLVEPEYVPIVVARKSALYQWAGEVSKFMRDMEVVVADGEPYERAAAYDDFFGKHDPARKRLLLLTYDSVLKDGKQSVVRDRSFKPPKEAKAALRDAKRVLAEASEAFRKEKESFESYFSARGVDYLSYLREVLKPSDAGAPPPDPPPGWCGRDDERLRAALSARDAVREAQRAADRAKDAVEPPLVVPGVNQHVRELLKRKPGTKIMSVFDEAHVLKNYQGKIHKECAELASVSERVVGVTATPVKNRLMEFFSIFRVVHPSLFPKVTHFHRDYCIVKMQPIGRGRKVPIVVGHSDVQLDAFVKAAEPFYLSRRKHEVAKELPELVTREVSCALSDEQEELYEIAELGLMDEGGDPDAGTTAILKAMTMVQQASNAPQLLMDEEGRPFEGESSKLEALVDALQDSPDMKTIVFSRFEKMISLIEARLKKEGIPCVRITGKESDPRVRRDAVLKFQDPASGINVVLITTAGSESLNLQAAGHIVCVDSPFSWGDYVQLTGRAVRIGSRHPTVIVTHLVARRRGGGKTIDDHVIKILRSKKRLADKVSGESLKGALEFTDEAVVREIFELIRSSREGGTEDEVRKKVREASAKKVRPASRKKAAVSARPPDPPEAAVRAVATELDLSDV